MPNAESRDKPESVNRFTEQLAELGIVSADDIARVTSKLRQQAPLTAQAVATALVKADLVTKYQAKMVYQGKGEQLRIGEYLVLDRLGEGGMGQVLKAHHQAMDRLVALKVLHGKLLSSDDMVNRFKKEVRAAGKLTHPNIVTAYDAGQQHGTHYLVMQYVDGKDLSSVVSKSGPLSISDAVNCVLQTAQGLAYAHEQGIVHRDIKPANLILSSNGSLKILDMGLASISQEVNDELTQSGQIMGTVDYMSPEQARGTKEVDGRGDVYSLGCTLYKLICGKAMYKRESAVGVIMAHQSDPIPTLTAQNPAVRHELNDVYLRMVAKNPEDRYQTMDEVVAAFEALDQPRGSKPVAAVPETKPKDGNLNAFIADLEQRDTDPDAGVVTKSAIRPVTARERGQRRQQVRMLWFMVCAGIVCVAALIATTFVLTRPTQGDKIQSNSSDDAGDSNVTPPKDSVIGRWVIEEGGSVWIASGEEDELVRTMSELDGSAVVKRVSFLTPRKFTPDELGRFVELPNLTHLTLNFDDLHDSHLREIQKVKQLRHLGLGSGLLSRASSRQIAAALSQFENLESLSLGNLNTGGNCLSLLPKPQKLKTLHLSNPDDLASWIALLPKHPQLRELHLDHAVVDGTSVARLAEATSIEELTLSRSRVDRAAREQLSRLEQLRKLSLTKGVLPTDELTALRRAMPRWDIAQLNSSPTLAYRSDLSRGLEDVTDMDRHVSARVIEHDGRVAIVTIDRETRWLTAVDDIPASHFTVVEIVVRGLHPQTDDEWKCFEKLRGLRTLRFELGVDLSDRDCESIAALDWPQLRELRLLTSSHMTDEGVRAIATLKDVRVLSLSGGDFTSTSLEHLVKMQALGHLILTKQSIEPAGFAHLAEHPALTKLTVDSGTFADEHLEKLAPSPTLNGLQLTGTNVTSAGFESLAKTTSLEHLQLEQRGYGDVEVATIANAVPQLKSLWIYADALTDDGMNDLSSMKQLVSIAFWRCGDVTDAGLAKLLELEYLETLSLLEMPDDAAITQDGIDELQRQRPNLKILGR